MDDLFQETLKVLEASFAALEGQVEKPRKVVFKHSFRFRYEQKSIHQALVQKLARTISTLHAARILLLNGFVQEQGALQRMLDEFEEDVLFLSDGVMRGQLTDLHEKYLSYFYEEEFEDPDNPAFSPNGDLLAWFERASHNVPAVKPSFPFIELANRTRSRLVVTTIETRRSYVLVEVDESSPPSNIKWLPDATGVSFASRGSIYLIKLK